VAGKRAARKAKEKLEQQKYFVVSSPVALVVDEVVGEDELRETLKERAEQMDLPLERVVESGLFKIFKEEVKISTMKTNIELNI